MRTFGKNDFKDFEYVRDKGIGNFLSKNLSFNFFIHKTSNFRQIL